jgi:hypothetical protein
VFETHESRKLKNLRYVPVPNRHDGKSFRRLALMADAPELFCAYQLIIEVASKMPIRGRLEDEDGPLDADDLQFKTGFPVRIFELAFEKLTDGKIGWLGVDFGMESPEEEFDLIEPPPPLAPQRTEQNPEPEEPPPFSSPAFLEALKVFEQQRKEQGRRARLTPTARKLMFNRMREMGEGRATAALIWSAEHNYRGLYEQNAQNNWPAKNENGPTADSILESRRRRRGHS